MAPCFYCIALFIAFLLLFVFYYITVRFVVIDYRTCLGLGSCIYLAIQLFSCSAASMSQ